MKEWSQRLWKIYLIKKGAVKKQPLFKFYSRIDKFSLYLYINVLNYLR
jgi:hypothetical protein